MTILEATAFGYAELSATSPSAHRDCDILLQHAVGRYAHFCIAHPEYILTEQEEGLFREHIAKRVLGMPIAYIIETKEFYGRDIFVNQHVLIPRPETEGLIDLVLQHIPHPYSPLRVLDLCTGSGCIAITLKHALPNSTMTATDISPEALLVAQLNSRRFHLDINYYVGDIFAALPDQSAVFDCIVANPPYVPLEHLEEDIPETVGLAFEPRIALLPEERSPQGMEIIQRILAHANTHLTATGLLALEISDHHAHAVLQLAHEYFPHKTAAIHNDLSGRPRYLIVQ